MQQLCFDVEASTDTVLERAEVATLFVYICYGINVTVPNPTTRLIIIDNNGNIVFCVFLVPCINS